MNILQPFLYPSDKTFQRRNSRRTMPFSNDRLFLHINVIILTLNFIISLNNLSSPSKVAEHSNICQYGQIPVEHYHEVLQQSIAQVMAQNLTVMLNFFYMEIKDLFYFKWAWEKRNTNADLSKTYLPIWLIDKQTLSVRFYKLSLNPPI